MMSGFVMGNATLNYEVLALQAGQLFLKKQDEKFGCLVEYLLFTKPTASQQNDLSSQITKFNVVLDNAIKRSLDVIGENQVWVPLSGGLDSRLVLSKLKNTVAKIYFPLVMVPYVILKQELLGELPKCLMYHGL